MMVQVSGFYLRPCCRSDRDRVWRLLRILPRLYPNGDDWLDRRLSDAVDGKASCTVAVSGPLIIGATIESPKGSGVLKLSTIWVHERFRRMGVGRALLARCYRKWLVSNINRTYITADSRVSYILSPLLIGYGFRERGLEANRYGEGRHEVVFSWTPGGAPQLN